jgi:hypothetical protein
MGEPKNAIRTIGKSEETTGRPRRGLEDNIKTDPRERGWGGMDWIDLAQDSDQ